MNTGQRRNLSQGPPPLSSSSMTTGQSALPPLPPPSSAPSTDHPTSSGGPVVFIPYPSPSNGGNPQHQVPVQVPSKSQSGLPVDPTTLERGGGNPPAGKGTEYLPPISDSSNYRTFSLRRTFSRMSKRSYMSNLSTLNRENLLRFGRSKITFLVINTIYTMVGLLCLILSLLTWFKGYNNYVLAKSFRPDILILLTIISAIQSVTGLIGYYGALKHKKTALTIYNLVIWVVLGGILAVAYLAYKDLNSPKFDENLYNSWTKFSEADKLIVQNQYGCCGYYSQFDSVAVSKNCEGLFNSDNTATTSLVRRAILERRATTTTTGSTTSGCVAFVRPFAVDLFRNVYTIGFAMIPVCAFAFVSGILSANHIYND